MMIGSSWLRIRYVDDYSRISGSCGDDFLDRKIERKEILGCIKKID